MPVITLDFSNIIKREYLPFFPKNDVKHLLKKNLVEDKNYHLFFLPALYLYLAFDFVTFFKNIFLI